MSVSHTLGAADSRDRSARGAGIAAVGISAMGCTPAPRGAASIALGASLMTPSRRRFGPAIVSASVHPCHKTASRQLIQDRIIRDHGAARDPPGTSRHQRLVDGRAEAGAENLTLGATEPATADRQGIEYTERIDRTGAIRSCVDQCRILQRADGRSRTRCAGPRILNFPVVGAGAVWVS